MEPREVSYPMDLILLCHPVSTASLRPNRGGADVGTAEATPLVYQQIPDVTLMGLQAGHHYLLSTLVQDPSPMCSALPGGSSRVEAVWQWEMAGRFNLAAGYMRSNAMVSNRGFPHQ
ncbi:hypothetical protein R1flu_005096 [Riccia fluitans]|uniref:Uncharacterized protein n=1 Tax=Riccia fluitans TaxID=41844 RepID=A0ABD1YS64_9MARC